MLRYANLPRAGLSSENGAFREIWRVKTLQINIDFFGIKSDKLKIKIDKIIEISSVFVHGKSMILFRNYDEDLRFIKKHH